jgi:hypothetical protein
MPPVTSVLPAVKFIQTLHVVLTFNTEREREAIIQEEIPNLLNENELTYVTLDTEMAGGPCLVKDYSQDFP